MSPRIPTRSAHAFIMIEMLLALSLFGMSAVALIKTLARTSQLALESQMDVRMLLRVQSRLTEISKLSDLSQWKDQIGVRTDPDDLGVWTETTVEEMKEIQNADGQQVSQMYRIYVKAFYHVDWKSEPETMDAEVWRYLPLYRNTGSSAPVQPQ